MNRPSLALLAALALEPDGAGAQSRIDLNVGSLPPCTTGGPKQVFVVHSASSTTCDGTTGSADALCCCLNAAWAACNSGGGGGSGDITQVWGCTTGDCSSLPGAAGDSLDGSSADYVIPWIVSTTPTPTAEGRAGWDSDDNRIAVGDGSGTKLFYSGTRAASTTDGGPATTCNALAANGGNCSAGRFPLGVDASGAAESCTTVASVAAPYDQYDSMRPPSSCAVCEDFTNDTEALGTWGWANQDSATSTITHDGLHITGEVTNDEIRGRCFDPPSSGNTDFTAHTYFSGSAETTTSCGIMFLTGGSIGSPTQTTFLRLRGDNHLYLTTDSDYDYANGGAANQRDVNIGSVFGPFLWTGGFLRFSYNNTTGAVTGAISDDGHRWTSAGAAFTVSGDPTKVCLMVEEDGTCRFDFARARTDASSADSGE